MVAGRGVTRCEGDTGLRQGALCHDTSYLSSGMWSGGTIHPDDEITSQMERQKIIAGMKISQQHSPCLYLSKNKYKSVTFVMLDISKII